MNRKEIYFIFRKEVVQMDALVEGLMEELNCETVFTIPLFGGIPVYESVVVTWIIMAVVFLLFPYIPGASADRSCNPDQTDPTSVPEAIRLHAYQQLLAVQAGNG